jgi:hypothetical protein
MAGFIGGSCGAALERNGILNKFGESVQALGRYNC